VQAFKLDPDISPWKASIAGHRHPIHPSPPDSHFANVNLLGGDFFFDYDLRPWKQQKSRAVTYYIGGNWQVTPKL
jgi:hypothetical protein